MERYAPLAIAPLSTMCTTIFTYYELTVRVGERHITIQVNKAQMHERWWENMRYQIVRGVIVYLAEKLPAKVNSKDIIYVLHPALALKELESL